MNSPSRTALFTSESVTEGHPDKVADQVSDAILDALLAQDPYSRVACETLVKSGLCVVAGEITTGASVDYREIARQVILDIGYDHPDKGFDANGCDYLVALTEQAREIGCGVDRGGAGDQGMMFGFACRNTPQLMPLPIALAHGITRRLADLRAPGQVAWIRPDGKSQVTVAYDGFEPVRVEAIVVSVQHAPDVSQEEIARVVRTDVCEPVVRALCTDRVLEAFHATPPIYHVNPSGSFVTGGPQGDCGLTGRKIIVDTYGGMGRHGGGAFSGKDPSKVDRSAAYMARYIAKNVVAARLADRCEVQLAYAIGLADPVSVRVDTMGTARGLTEHDLDRLVREHFDCRPDAIVEVLDLRKPQYRKTAAYGHLGRENEGFRWEDTDRAEALREAAHVLTRAVGAS